VTLSVVIITYNEEANIGRTLKSVLPLVANGHGEIIVVDSGSTDRTVEIARELGAKVFVEEWKGYAAQKNSAIAKASGNSILSLDADEELESGLVSEIATIVGVKPADPATSAVIGKPWCLTLETPAPVRPPSANEIHGYWIPRKNFFLGRWIRHGGFWPDRKLRLFRRGTGTIAERAVHEVVKVDGPTGRLQHALLHHAYPTLAGYTGHMNRYSSLGAEMAVADGYRGFSFVDIVLRPLATFIYNYFFRLGFLDGREGLLLNLYHAVYVSWKYAKVWELSRKTKG
jgi:glycosyltransferase involved in cell wall biosynthesis